MDVDGARVDVGIVAPDRFEQPLAREDAAGVLEEMPQQPELGRAEWDWVAVAADPVAADVHLDVGITELLASQRRADAAQNRADPGHELARAERLGHIIVGARVEAADTVALLAARSQHHDRNIGGCRAAAQASTDL